MRIDRILVDELLQSVMSTLDMEVQNIEINLNLSRYIPMWEERAMGMYGYFSTSETRIHN